MYGFFFMWSKYMFLINSFNDIYRLLHLQMEFIA